jgi:acyl-CoA reductase-like NAD-dependent aldehyde dehydrogenase
MSMYFAASVLVAQLAAAPAAVTIPEDWASAPPPSRKAIDAAVRDILAEEQAAAAALARRNEANTLRGDKYDTFAARFEEAAVPGCLRPDGLKRQPTSIGPFGVSGLLALPLVLVAKIRGKCN